MNDTESGGVFCNYERSATLAGNLFDVFTDLLRKLRTLLFKEAGNGIDGALADAGAGQVDAGHAGLRAEGNELGVNAAEIASANRLQRYLDAVRSNLLFAKSVVLIVSALFPIVNPLGGSPIFLALTREYPAPARRTGA